jgi:superfamily I DNA and/or RNA helicase
LKRPFLLLVSKMKKIDDTNTRLIAQIENWRSRLLDIGNRNPLISTPFSATRGVLDLLSPDPEGIWKKLIVSGEAGTRSMRFAWKKDIVVQPKSASIEDEDLLAADPESQKEQEKKDWNPSISDCLKSARYSPDELLTQLGDRGLDRRIRTLDGHAQLSISEQGLHCLFLAFGFIKWYESSDSIKEIRSPLILIPASLSRERADANWELLKAEDDIIDNLCLRQRLKQDFGLLLPELPEIDQLEEEGGRQAYFDQVRRAISKNKGWSIEDRCCLGRFAFPKVSMWQDLGDHIEAIAENTLCRAIAGKAELSLPTAFGTASSVPDASKLDDSLEPGEIKAILDCDSSQLEAILAARKGVSFVLDGPPGTGKSQTIANIIADALSVGKRVLFVSEKVAALDVVKKRLDECGVGEFCLECHSSKANRSEVLKELKACLEMPIEIYADPKPKLTELRNQRDQLNNYVRLLHKKQSPLGISLYELFGFLAGYKRQGLIGLSKIALPKFQNVTRKELDSWKELLRQSPQHRNVLANIANHPWQGCKLTSSSLLIKSNIQENCSSLEAIAEKLLVSLEPLRLYGFSPSEMKVAELKPLLEKIDINLSIPRIPLEWFPETAAVASSLSARFESQNDIDEKMQSMPEYNEGFEERFQEETTSLSDMRGMYWISRLTRPLASNYRDCQAELAERASRLQRLENVLYTLEQSLKQLISKLQLPIKTELQIGSISKLISASKIVANESPFRHHWFDTGATEKFLELAHQAISTLEAIKHIEKNFEGRIDLDKILTLSSGIADSAQLKRSYSKLKAKIPEERLNALSDLITVMEAENLKLEFLESSIQKLFADLDFDQDYSPTKSEMRDLLSVLPSVQKVQGYNSKWADAATRQNLLKRIKSAILDVREARDLRLSLEGKFSHRAFLPSSRPVIERGQYYLKWWRRVLGGYGSFRSQLADLYKGSVPETKELLNDLQLINAYHRRVFHIEVLYQDVKEGLLSSTVIEDPESWQRNIDGIDAIGLLLERVPAISKALKGERLFSEIKFDQTAINDLTLSLADPGTEEIAWSDDLLKLKDLPIRESRNILGELLSASVAIARAKQLAQNCYLHEPQIEQVLEDLISAQDYEEKRKKIEEMFASHRDWLSSMANPFERKEWDDAIHGIESAGKLAGVFGASSVLTSVVCTPDQIKKGDLLAAIQATESSMVELNDLWVEEIDFISLVRAGEGMTELKRRSLSELRHCATDASAEFSSIARCLGGLLDVLKPGMNVPLERLPKDWERIKDIRQAKRKIALSNEVLSKYNVTIPVGQEHELDRTCNWILASPPQLLAFPLGKAMATCEQARTIVEQVRETLHSVLVNANDSSKFLCDLFEPNMDVSFGFTPSKLTLQEIHEFLPRLRSSVDSLDEWIPFSRWRKKMVDEGFSVIVQELICSTYTPEMAMDAFCAKLYQGLYDHFIEKHTLIDDFDGARHEVVQEKYRQLDEWEVKSAATRVREFQLSREDRPRIGWIAPATSELGILKREAEKKRRHMPLRKLFNEIPGVLQRLKPCIMMSPLSVSTYLESEVLKFDLVIFDEASQVFPWDSIGAIYRGTQLIVAGDDKQLPPTSFFSRADVESEDEEDDISDFESILSLCKSVNMPNKRLRWHYRSRREPLIAFSNNHFYNRDLVTFPSTRDAAKDSVRLVKVPKGVWADRKNLEEARKVAELVVDHYLTDPTKSLGVIAFNATQQQAIEDAIYQLRRKSTKVDSLLKNTGAEPLFVKNLENVQGDERDCILLSFAYGRNENGVFIKNFGPLSKPGGERRLNVAVTRARETVTLVASIVSADMDLSNSSSLGANLLKAYMEYAEFGVNYAAQQSRKSTLSEESGFEHEVAAALAQHGFEPEANVGCGGFRIDIALKHPADPNVYCLGIECDGANYRSSNTARDRDRIRQAILKGLGWRILRVWSTDWIRNPETQIQRILTEYQQAGSTPLESDLPIDIHFPDFDDLMPKIVEDEESQVHSYKKIDEVPSKHIVEIAIRILTRNGATDWAELIASVSRALGFGRTGRNIHTRIESVLLAEVEQARLHRSGSKVSLLP